MTELNNVDEYITSFPAETQKILTKIRTAIKETVPEAEELIAYRMPAYKLNGKPLVYFGGFKNHVGFYPTGSGVSAFEPELKRYKHARGSIQFPIDKEIPLDLIKRILEFKKREIKGR